MKKTWIRFVLVIVLATTPSVGAAKDCSVSCSKGTKGICTRIKGSCYCACVKDLDSAQAQLRETLGAAGASEDAKDEARKLLTQTWKKGGEFTVTDREVGMVDVSVTK